MKIREILEDSLLIVRFSVYSCRDCLNFLISELDCSKKQSKIKMAMLIANIPVRDLHVKCKEFDNPRLYRVDSLSFDFDYSLTPYVFMIDKKGHISDFFIPRKEFPDQTKKYLERIGCFEKCIKLEKKSGLGTTKALMCLNIRSCTIWLIPAIALKVRSMG